MGLEHKYLLCKEEEEGSVPLLQALKDRGIKGTESYIPPGSHEEKLFSTEEIRIILRKLAGAIFGLHRRCGYTLSSNFTLENIWLTVHDDLKFHNTGLAIATYPKVNHTYRRLSKLLKENIFLDDLPLDIEQWLELMESTDAAHQEYCILCHPGIMADRNIMEFFKRVYKHLWPFKLRKWGSYHNIIKDLPYKGVWKTLVQQNDYLNELLEYKDCHGNLTDYSDGADGLIHFLKNCDSHLHEKAIIRGVPEPLFASWHLVPIICGTFPLFIGAPARIASFSPYNLRS